MCGFGLDGKWEFATIHRKIPQSRQTGLGVSYSEDFDMKAAVINRKFQVMGILCGLIYLHSENVVHSDLKSVRGVIYHVQYHPH